MGPDKMAVQTNNPLTLGANGMNLEDTLFCGQSFSWKKVENNIFHGVAGKRALFAQQQQDTLLLWNSDGSQMDAQDIAFWNHYFALDLDYFLLKEKFSRSKRLQQCVQFAPGVRVLRQPFFDTLLCFIISQNNHIPRITSISQRLRQDFGPRLNGGEFAFPSAETLATLTTDDLGSLRAGFRAKYLIDAAQKVASGQVSEEEIAALPNDLAREKLTQIYGVGTKVADCVLLYSFGRNDIVPMDVWMKRAIEKQFRGKMPLAAKGYEGIAQQFIFCWAREHL